MLSLKSMVEYHVQAACGDLPAGVKSALVLALVDGHVYAVKARMVPAGMARIFREHADSCWHSAQALAGGVDVTPLVEALK